jgi:hypothetical protein
MRQFFAVLCLVLSTSVANALDSFDSSTNQLTMGFVIADGLWYTNVVVQINGYTLLSEGGMPIGGADIFASGTGTLFLNQVSVDGVQHNNVLLHLNSYSVLTGGLIPTKGWMCSAPSCRVIWVGGTQACVFTVDPLLSCN